ncbi:MAG TPA: RluA family pseudouridine synthase, partial [Lysobacter sp.]
MPATLLLEARVPDACAGRRFDAVIAELFPEHSRSRLAGWIKAGQARLDGREARPRDPVRGGELVTVEAEIGIATDAPAEDIALDVLYEDTDVIVLDKPAGLVVHPGAGNPAGTLVNALLHRDPSLSALPRAGIVHRLDKDTSGLMVVGKTLAAQTDLVRQLQARSVKREYFALVWGTPQQAGTIDASMGRHPRDRVKMAVSTNFSAKPAITHYERVATGMLDRRPVSLVRCQLETGRTHQIRV